MEAIEVLFHKECGTQLQMGNKRVIFCPKCKVTEVALLVTHTLCCDVCEKPLAVTKDSGSYCLNCKFYPSMQDLCLIPIV